MGQVVTPAEAAAELTGPGGPFETVEEEVLGTRMRVFARRSTSLGELLAASAVHGDRDYLVTARTRISYAQHTAQVASLARVLREEYGVGRGDRVALLGANSPGWVVSFWAVVALGAVTAGFNARWAPPEIAHAARRVRPKAVICDAARAADARTALAGDGGPPVLTLEEDIAAHTARYPGEPLVPGPADEDDPAVILYTSGTSGHPKGAVHTHRNLLAVADYHAFGDEILRRTDPSFDPRDRRSLMTMPLFHIASLHNLALPRLASGAACVIHEGRFRADAVLRLIERERVTSCGVVPTMARRLIEHDGLEAYDLSSLTSFTLASAPSSPAFQERLRRALPVAERSLVDSYGLTETSTAVATASSADLLAHPGTVGRPIPTVEVEIRGPGGERLADGEEGEICVRSPLTMLGYWEDPEATARAVREDRWLHTGDLGTLRDGLLFISSRRSDLILRGGENVYPAEIEHVLSELPGVREAVVLGTPHEDLGEEVAAVVVVDEDGPDAAALAEAARGRLARYKVPTRWRVTTDGLPRNATGKVVRRDVAV